MKSNTGLLIGILTIVFVVLKLCGVIDWTWIWVLAPLWITALAWLGWLLLALVAVLVAALFTALLGGNKIHRKRARR